ncbi:ectoine hydroxylase [Gimesia fumaroli]|uniref:Ectoine hydroxylase n=1 Tax=Gimesia fumaroli TaxID=2527976 RepID=A0A518IHP6_9PLAN|nr:ectoine hydroxylase [Gimesia fumaroli]QDV52616.1 Phytanoyl-CoA dioxygenase (PhyH) [Gimesia fumaroli]
MTARTTPAATTNFEDLYPSRVKSYPETLDRQDPVVYGTAQDGPLTEEQLNQYERDGFLILPAFFSDHEVAAFRAELSALRDCQETKQKPEAILEPDHSELRSLFSVHRPEISPLFSKVASDKRIVQMTNQILGSEVYIHQSRVNLKPGFAGKEFFWHSDFETWHVEDGMPRMRAVSCSLLLDQNDEFNAPLMLVPGSQQEYIACVGETPDDHYQNSLRRQEVGIPDHQSLDEMVNQYGIVQGVGPAGSILLFDCNIMHGSNSNITPLPRSNLFFVYNSTSNYLVQPFGNQNQRPEFIASREDCEPIVPQTITHD